MAVSFACPDWEEKLRSGKTPLPDLPLDEACAAEAVRIFDMLQLPDVSGMPTLGEAAGPWFRDIVRNVFAAEDPESGLPAVAECLCLVPKKNSKTTYSAALALTALLLWERPNAEMMVLGPTQSIADRLFGQMQGMLRANPKLRKVFHVQDHLKTISRVKTGAKLRVKTFDMNVVTGEIPSLAIVDELHLLGAKNGAERVIGQITGGMVTNPRALVMYITTQSDQPPQGVFKKKLDYARGVRDGRITDRVRFLPVLYEFPERVQTDETQPWRDPAIWPQVLPNIGRSVHPDLLAGTLAVAQEEGPESIRLWASQHLNIQIGMALQDERWPGSDHWEASADPGLDLEAVLERSEVCTIGVDWGGADDLASLAVIGRDARTKEWLHWSMSWARPSVLERRKTIAEALRGFAADGDLAMVETPEDQASDAAAICARVAASGKLPEDAGIGLDAAGVALLVDALEAEGLVQPQVTAVPQGWKLMTAINSLPLKLEAGRMRHAGQPIMAWAVSNARQTLKGSNYVVTKQAAGAAKIDPLMATFNAAMLMFNAPAPPERFDWDAYLGKVA